MSLAENQLKLTQDVFPYLYKNEANAIIQRLLDTQIKYLYKWESNPTHFAQLLHFLTLFE